MKSNEVMVSNEKLTDTISIIYVSLKYKQFYKYGCILKVQGTRKKERMQTFKKYLQKGNKKSFT